MGTGKKQYKKKNAKKGLKKRSFMSRSLYQKKHEGIDTKVFYFSASGRLQNTVDGRTQGYWRTIVAGANPGGVMPLVGDNTTVAELYRCYKILAIKVVVFAANIGTEGAQRAGPDMLIRGNTCIMSIPDTVTTYNGPTGIIEAINMSGCRMIPSRVDRYSWTMYRPKGFNAWGVCDRNIPPAIREADPWNGFIKLLGNFSGNVPNPPGGAAPVTTLWYYKVTYKVIYKNRHTS